MTALLVIFLVSGHASSMFVDRDLCIKTAEAVKRGDRVTIEDEAGRFWEVEMARCIDDVKQETQEPIS